MTTDVDALRAALEEISDGVFITTRVDGVVDTVLEWIGDRTLGRPVVDGTAIAELAAAVHRVHALAEELSGAVYLPVESEALKACAIAVGVDHTRDPEWVLAAIAERYAAAAVDPGFDVDGVMVALMGDWSEDLYAAGWHRDIEFITWRQLTVDVTHEHPLADDPCRACLLRSLRDRFGRWVAWSNAAGGPVGVDAAEFEVRFNEWAREHHGH
jgi:hypothetical protein